MKRFELFFAFLQLPIDYFMIVMAGFTAYSLRYTELVTSIRPILFNLSWEKFFPVLLLVAAGWVVIYALSGLYTTNPNRKLSEDLLRVITASSSGFAAITIYVFFTLQKFDSRFLVLAGWIIAMVYVFLGRLFMRGIKGILYRSGFGLRPTVVIGNETISQTICETLKNEPRFGYKVIGVFPQFSDEIKKEIINLKAEEIIFTNGHGDKNEAVKIVNFSNTNHIVFKYSADLFQAISSNMTVSTIAGIPIVELRRTRLIGWWRIIKRLLDIVIGIILLIVCSPLLLLIALLVIIESGRPIIYKNERVGQYNKKFYTLKFRTMFQKYSTGDQFGKQGEEALKLEEKLIKTNNEKKGPIYKIKNDPRITPLGGFLRRWSLDELPQFINVIKGDMSLVGPRPHQPREVNKYSDEHSVLFAIKPGITGLAQISGRSNLSFEEEAKLDTFYVENWNLYLDLIILIKTPFIVFKGKGAW